MNICKHDKQVSAYENDLYCHDCNQIVPEEEMESVTCPLCGKETKSLNNIGWIRNFGYCLAHTAEEAKELTLIGNFICPECDGNLIPSPDEKGGYLPTLTCKGCGATYTT